ncbi:TetR family transcriptional regulator [Rhodococcus sp. BP22]|uniref:TetR family transcriptional regulator n=1 Tax=Rhodococcus sp. BP22 TaxID=2758566 RepID=UPI0016442154|nr:TetR family transcriptional regulator [Rhodococcus sp. BP22]
MPRIAEVRDAAEPSSVEQHARHVRIIQAAAALGAEKELARVQMHDVAKAAGVAIGTLYRYFPSKTHLFVAVMVDQIDRMGSGLTKRNSSTTLPSDAVYGVLVRATRGLLLQPLLSAAMIQSTTTANVTAVPDAGKVDRAFRQILLEAAGIETPTEADLTALRLVVQLWFGVIQSCLNGRVSFLDAELDIRRGCDLLLVDLSPR